MSEQQQITKEQFLTAKRMESLMRQNAQQAGRIAELEAAIDLIQAEAQQAQQPSSADIDEPLAGELPLDREEDDAKH